MEKSLFIILEKLLVNIKLIILNIREIKMKCVLCEEGTVTEVQETFMFSPRGYVPMQSLMFGSLCDTCGVFYSNSETYQKTFDYCQNLKKKMILLK